MVDHYGSKSKSFSMDMIAFTFRHTMKTDIATHIHLCSHILSDHCALMNNFSVADRPINPDWKFRS